MPSPLRPDDPRADAACPRDQLEWYASGALSAEERVAVEAHLDGCQACRVDARQWADLRSRLREVSDHTPAPRADLFAQIERRLDAVSRPALAGRVAGRMAGRMAGRAAGIAYTVGGAQRAAPTFRALGELIWLQARLLRPSLFWAPLLLAPVAATLVSLPAPWARSTDAVALLAALVVALGMAFLYGRDVDPAREMTLAAPTSPRLTLAVRSGLVFGFDLLINCGLILPYLILKGAATPAWFLAHWLAPLCFLSAISLLVSVVVNANAAVLVCVSLWGLRALSGAPTLLFGGSPAILVAQWQQLYSGFWRQEQVLFFGAVVAVILAFAVLERRELISR